MARKPVNQKNEKPAAVAGGERAVDYYSEENIAKRQEGKLMATPGLEVIADAWDGEVAEGNPFDDAAKPFIEQFSDMHFRFLSDAHCEKRGKRGYQEVRKDSKNVVVAGMKLAAIPKRVHQDRHKKAVREAMDALETSRETYREQEQRAVRDSGGTIAPLPEEREIYQGSRRIE